MDEYDPNKELNGLQLFVAAVSLSILLVPLCLVAFIPNNPTVDTLFGGNRLFVFWAVIYGIAFVFRKPMDRYADNWERKRKENHD